MSRMYTPSHTQAFTLVEMMVALAVSTIVMGGILVMYIGLQKSFIFGVNWSEARVTQTRVLDSMAQDLRNAILVNATNGGLPLTLTIPTRFSAYASGSNSFAGDPDLGATLNNVSISSTDGKVLYGGTINVVYAQSGNNIIRQVQIAGNNAYATRTVGVFGGGVAGSFNNTNGVAFTSADNTIVPTVTGTVASWNINQSVTSTMTDTVYLRGVNYK